MQWANHEQTTPLRAFALHLLPLVIGFVSWAAQAAPGLGPADPARIIGEYALTSANDFPQRDPSDWRLLGSNDGGRNWVELDARQREIFSDRHQRRLFTVTKPGAYRVYRLQIDRVRNPPAADSVQFAELELFAGSDADPSPMPLPVDAITAQGQNPPLETTGTLFDGEPETKWLDHALQSPATRSSWIQWEYRGTQGWVVTNLATLRLLHRRAAEGYPVKLRATVVGGVPGTNRVWVMDDTARFALTLNPPAKTLLPAERILLEGTSRWTNQQVTIAVSSIENDGKKPGSEPTRIRLDYEPADSPEAQWGETEGKLGFCTWARDHWTFELEENDRSVRVHVMELDDVARSQLIGARVRIRGVCIAVQNAKGQRVPGELWVASCDSIRLIEGAPLTEGRIRAQPVVSGTVGSMLTDIEQVRRLSPEELVRRPMVRVQGVVTEIFGGYIQEGGAGVEVWYGAQPATNIPGFGTCVEIAGRGDWANGHGPIIRAEKVSRLGKGKLPNPERCSYSQLASGRMVDQWVEIEAVVRSTDGSHLLLSCEGGRLMATIRSGAAPVISGLVDATVRIRGVSVAASDSRGRLQGIQLLVPSLEFVEVEQPPTEPFELPTRRIGSLLQVRGPKEFIHRVKIEGVLTLQDGRNYYLQDGTGAALAVAKEDVMLDTPSGGRSWLFSQQPASNGLAASLMKLEPGDHVEIVGFPEMRGYSPMLTEVLARRIGRTNLVTPVRATIQDILAGSVDSTLVTLEGVLLRQEVLGAHSVLELQSGQRVFQTLLRPGVKPLAAIVPGSRVQVTGVCQIDPLPYAELGKSIASFKLLARSPADVLVIESPSWWTMKRIGLAAALLLIGLGVAAGWIGILRRQVEERTSRLRQEIDNHEKTEALLAAETRRVHAEIEERKRIEAEVEKGHKQLLVTSRLAGMAEVATGVLHNVGNVLNSVNVLASLMYEQVQRSKAASVARLAGLFDEHRDDLGRFINEDPKGRQLPGYLRRLGGHLAEEQTRLIEKLRSLTECVQHIKEIVAMQQNYAKVSGVLETVSPVEIVEDALRMHSGSLARHQVEVIREFDDVPAATVDRHKVLQILFNLLENAKYACDAGSATEKRVTVRVRHEQERRVLIEVADNGIGIASENLGRIFAQEFSTRRGGHGFGLHSSKLAAQEMGGELTARSEGQNQGATFILAIPLGSSDLREERPTMWKPSTAPPGGPSGSTAGEMPAATEQKRRPPGAAPGGRNSPRMTY